MKRIMVIGAPGTGKTHFSQQLSTITGIEVTHMDLLYWNADKTPVTHSVFRSRLLNVLHRDAWILDGNYQRTLDLRMHHCDTVFFLDYSVDTALRGLDQQRVGPRDDVPWVGDHPSPKVHESVSMFPARSRPAIVDKLRAFDDDAVHIFRSRAEAETFLTELAANTPDQHVV